MGIRIMQCSLCGNTIVFLDDSGVTPVCCGKEMHELKPGAVDAAVEKHVPVVIKEQEKKAADSCVGTRTSKQGSCSSYATVRIGSTAHPMTDDHFIQWVLLVTNLGTYVKYLEPGDIPEVCFCLTAGEKVEVAYAYCNLHGLWVDK